MSDDVSAVRKVIGVEEHAWTAETKEDLMTQSDTATTEVVAMSAPSLVVSVKPLKLSADRKSVV